MAASTRVERRAPLRPQVHPVLVAYVCAVVLAGAALLALDLEVARAPATWAAFTTVAACAAVGELLPVRLSAATGDDAGLTTSTIFSFALLLGFGPGPAAAALVVANVLPDLRRRLPFYKTAFNA